MIAGTDLINRALGSVAEVFSALIFHDIAGFPFIVLWLIVAGVFFTLYLRGVNFRLFRHAVQVAQGKFDRAGEAGELKPLRALLSALAATVGLGSIAGISVGIATGGPGAVLWIVIAGFLGMATKFAEVTLSLCYRRTDAEGKVFGGPFQYIRHGLEERGLGTLGRALAVLFAIFCLFGGLGGGNMFQSNQAVAILTETFRPLAGKEWLISLAFAGFVLIVLLGSIKRVASVADVIVPLKGILYLLCALVIIGVNIHQLPAALGLIWHDAWNGRAVAGGFVALLSVAFARASFANEAGLGSAPIAHATAKTDEPVREGALALLEPLLAASVGLLTGLILVVSGAYLHATGADGKAIAGVAIASRAFATVSPWFPWLLTANVLIFAYSTTIGWSYYGEIAWSYLFGRRGIRFYQLIFCTATFLGGIVRFDLMLTLADLFILGMSFPNLVAVYLLRKRVRAEMDGYVARLQRL